MCSADVTAAFLQAINLEREVHVKPVAEAGHQGLLWKLKKPMYGVKDVKTAIKMTNHVKNHPVKVRYNKLPGDEWFISVYTDAAKNLLPDGTSSAQGYIVFLTNGHKTNELGPACPLYWKSGKSSRIVGSTMEGEAMAMEEGLHPQERDLRHH